MSKDEMRNEVATCVRMLEFLGLIDFSGHVSSRIPGAESMFINSWGASRHGLGPQDIIEANLAGKPIEKDVKLPSEVHIHASIYRQRADINAIEQVTDYSPGWGGWRGQYDEILPALFPLAP